MGGVRLRLVFEDKRLLTTPHRRNGLGRCWLLLPSHLTTVSDLASHVSDKFKLHEACPQGILLAMEDFILPSFESTDVFKDKDVISVKRKGKKFLRVNDNALHLSDQITEFEISKHNEYECSAFDNKFPFEAPGKEGKTSQRKIRHADELIWSKSKGVMLESAENFVVYHKQSHAKERGSCKGSCYDDKSTAKEVGQYDMHLVSQADTIADDRTGFTTEDKGHRNVEEYDITISHEFDAVRPEKTSHTRNAEFEKKTRKLQRKCYRSKRNKIQQTLPCDATFSKDSMQSQSTEKILCSNPNADVYEASVSTQKKFTSCQMNFKELQPLTRLPKEGDVVAYRLFQSSPLEGPELSSFQVGKVSSYDASSMKIILVLVPEYPISSNGNVTQASNVPYRVDGSLEFEYPALVDVRLLSTDNMEGAMMNNFEREQVTKNGKDRNGSLTGLYFWKRWSGEDGWDAWPTTKPSKSSWYNQDSTSAATKMPKRRGCNNVQPKGTHIGSSWAHGREGNTQGFSNSRAGARDGDKAPTIW